mgnify:CR=1 FL=1
MNFKQYLAELNKLEGIEAGQAFEKHETPTDGSISISNPKVRAEINYRLDGELDDIFLSPESGIQKVRKVLHRFSLDMPALYDADVEGDEIDYQAIYDKNLDREPYSSNDGVSPFSNSDRLANS